MKVGIKYHFIDTLNEAIKTRSSIKELKGLSSSITVTEIFSIISETMKSCSKSKKEEKSDEQYKDYGYRKSLFRNTIRK